MLPLYFCINNFKRMTPWSCCFSDTSVWFLWSCRDRLLPSARLLLHANRLRVAQQQACSQTLKFRIIARVVYFFQVHRVETKCYFCFFGPNIFRNKDQNWFAHRTCWMRPCRTKAATVFTWHFDKRCLQRWHFHWIGNRPRATRR